MNFIEAFLKNFLIAAIISSKSFDPLNKVGLSYVPFSNQVALVQSIPLSDSKIEGCLISISDERIVFSGGNPSGNLFSSELFQGIFEIADISEGNSHTELIKTSDYEAKFIFSKRGIKSLELVQNFVSE